MHAYACAHTRTQAPTSAALLHVLFVLAHLGTFDLSVAPFFFLFAPFFSLQEKYARGGGLPLAEIQSLKSQKLKHTLVEREKMASLAAQSAARAEILLPSDKVQSEWGGYSWLLFWAFGSLGC